MDPARAGLPDWWRGPAVGQGEGGSGKARKGGLRKERGVRRQKRGCGEAQEMCETGETRKCCLPSRLQSRESDADGHRRSGRKQFWVLRHTGPEAVRRLGAGRNPLCSRK